MRRERDIFDIVIQRKKDIDKRQATVDNRLERERLENERLKDPIARETLKAVKIGQSHRELPHSLQKVLAAGENSEHFPKVDQKTFNRLRKRGLILELTDPSYHCPGCFRVFTKINDWIISKDKKKIMCRSCFYTFRWDRGETSKVDFSNVELHLSVEYDYLINATDLCRKRESTGKTVKQFAGLVGWSASYQYKLENGQILSLSKKAMSELAEAFDRLGANITMSIWGDPKEKYVPNGQIIRQIREMKCVSQLEFANQAGWSVSYQNQIEQGKKKFINKRTMGIVSSILISDTSLTF